jgi:RNA polymerase sigma-70 factor (sigma-E family)
VSDFEWFVASHGPGLTRFAYLICGDEATAQDLTQTSLLKVFKLWSKVSALDDPLAYTRRIVTREYLSLRRKRSSSEVLVAAPSLAGAWPDPADQIAVRDELWGALQRLPAKQRAALVLRYYVDLSHEEIAVILDCPISTVRSHTRRGLAALREARTVTEKGVCR